MSIYINDQRMIPSEFMQFEEVDLPETIGFDDSIERLVQSETPY